MQINVTKESLSNGSDFMNTYHSGLSEDTVIKLTGDSSNITSNNMSLDSEHICNVKTMKAKESEQLTGTEHESLTNEFRYTTNRSTKSRTKKINQLYKVTDDDMKNMMKGSSLSFNAEDMLKNRFNRFSRYGYLDPANELITGAREYVFFSKPDLHLMNGDGSLYKPLNSNAFLKEAYMHYRYSFYSLQQYLVGDDGSLANSIKLDSSVGAGNDSVFDLNNKYIPLLSNMITSSLDLNDITASDIETNRNLYQVNTTYREGSLASDLQYDFSTEFKDTKYLDVYMLFKIYDEYFRHKFYEDIAPNRKDYITSRIYPEAISIWKIIVDDSDRIIYWAKAIGCTPMSVPRGTISNLEGTVKFTINWKAQFVKDMDLLELNHLTELSMNDKQGVISGMTNGETWVGYPYVILGNESVDGFHSYARTGEVASAGQKFYRLAWINKV